MKPLYAYTGLLQERAIYLASNMLAGAIHNCICSNCGEHIDIEAAIDFTLANMYSYCCSPAEHHYVLLLIGKKSARSDENENYWDTVLGYKKDTFERTVKSLIKGAWRTQKEMDIEKERQEELKNRAKTPEDKENVESMFKVDPQQN